MSTSSKNRKISGRQWRQPGPAWSSACNLPWPTLQPEQSLSTARPHQTDVVITSGSNLSNVFDGLFSPPITTILFSSIPT